jgi:uncharacterized protein YndB with AHSA1/START domain
MRNRGIYLEVVPNQRLVAADAYINAWQPSDKPFMTLVLTFENAGGDGEGRLNVRFPPRCCRPDAPAPVHLVAVVMGRHPKHFTEPDIGPSADLSVRARLWSGSASA